MRAAKKCLSVGSEGKSSDLGRRAVERVEQLAGGDGPHADDAGLIAGGDALAVGAESEAPDDRLVIPDMLDGGAAFGPIPQSDRPFVVTRNERRAARAVAQAGHVEQ